MIYFECFHSNLFSLKKKKNRNNIYSSWKFLFLVYVFIAFPMLFPHISHCTPLITSCLIMLFKTAVLLYFVLSMTQFPGAIVFRNLKLNAGVTNKSGPESKAVEHYYYSVFFWLEIEQCSSLTELHCVLAW